MVYEKWYESSDGSNSKVEGGRVTERKMAEVHELTNYLCIFAVQTTRDRKITQLSDE